MLTIGIIGALGRMGQAICDELSAQASLFQIKAACTRPGHLWVGRDYGTALGRIPMGITLTDDPGVVFKQCDVAIDFSSPQALSTTLKALLQTPRPLVIGVTGFELPQSIQHLCKDASTITPVFYAANMSLGMALLLKLIGQAAKALPADYQIDIVDDHHCHKKDSPSGTALAMAHKAAEERDQRPEEVIKTSLIDKRLAHTIHIASVRAGGMVGHLKTHFTSMNERITLGHQAFSRRVFAQGALKAAQWLSTQPPGFYGMDDMAEIF